MMFLFISSLLSEPEVKPVLVLSVAEGFRMVNVVWVKPDLAFDCPVIWR